MSLEAEGLEYADDGFATRESGLRKIKGINHREDIAVGLVAAEDVGIDGEDVGNGLLELNVGELITNHIGGVVGIACMPAVIDFVTFWHGLVPGFIKDVPHGDGFVVAAFFADTLGEFAADMILFPEDFEAGLLDVGESTGIPAPELDGVEAEVNGVLKVLGRDMVEAEGEPRLAIAEEGAVLVDEDLAVTHGLNGDGVGGGEVGFQVGAEGGLQGVGT